MEVTRTRTAVSMDQVRHAVRRAWLQLTHYTLTASIEALILALVDLETRGGQAIWNFNLGNIVSTGEGSWFTGLDAGNVRRFRAFESLDSGAVGLVRQLLSPTRPVWREGLLTGDPVTYVRALGGELGGHYRYFEAPVERYLAAYLQRWETYRPSADVQRSDVQRGQTRRARASTQPARSGAPVGAILTVLALSMMGVVYALRG